MEEAASWRRLARLGRETGDSIALCLEDGIHQGYWGQG